MEKYKKIFLLLCILIAIAPIAMAVQNATNNINITTTTSSPTATEGKFRVGPEIRLRPVTDVIETNQDGVVELFMRNPSLNDVMLHVDASVSVPSGIHVYGEGFAQAVGAGTAAGTFDIPPGTARTIAIVIKVDKSARIGSHTISFSGLYYPDENKDLFEPISLTYPFNVLAPSLNPDDPKSTNPNPGTSKEEGRISDIIEEYWWIFVLLLISLIAIVAFGWGGSKS